MRALHLHKSEYGPGVVPEKEARGSDPLGMPYKKPVLFETLSEVA